ncbi:MAG: Rieske (2Fe-2S) protein [Gemmatimonadaceae bacterium]|nr:Rieske (2Fe-2S) protein [Gemmatimonadaceae bacterium]
MSHASHPHPAMSTERHDAADHELHDCPGSCATDQVREGLAFLTAEAVRLDRRGFLTQSMLAAAALALAACGSDGVTGTTSPGTVGASIKLSDYASLSAVGGVALVTLSGASLAIVRTGADTFIALSRSCPHEGALVSSTSTGFTCPRHGARFSITGTWTGGQRTSSMRSYTTTYDATAGTVTIG